MTNIIFKALILIITTISFTSCTKKTLSNQMAKLNVNTTLIVAHHAMNEFPLWSPESDFVASKIDGNWFKFSLKNIKLNEAVWVNQKIGVLTNKNGKAVFPLSEKEKSQFVRRVMHNGRGAITRHGTGFELSLEELSSSLIITKNGTRQAVWKSDFDNCHSLSLSPNEEYIAYICELSGLFVMKVPK